MVRLALILHLFIGSTLAGLGVIAALVTGNDTVTVILAAAVLGYVVGYPASWFVAKALYEA